MLNMRTPKQEQENSSKQFNFNSLIAELLLARWCAFFLSLLVSTEEHAIQNYTQSPHRNSLFRPSTSTYSLSPILPQFNVSLVGSPRNVQIYFGIKLKFSLISTRFNLTWPNLVFIQPQLCHCPCPSAPDGRTVVSVIIVLLDGSGGGCYSLSPLGPIPYRRPERQH